MSPHSMTHPALSGLALVGILAVTGAQAAQRATPTFSIDVAAETLAGRMTRSELERDCRDIFDGIVAAEGAGGNGSGLTSDAYSDVRGLLAEISRTRARQGFTPTETAVGVFGLKEAAIGVPAGWRQPVGGQHRLGGRRRVTAVPLALRPALQVCRQAGIGAARRLEDEGLRGL